MRSTIDGLSTKEKQLLADFYNTPTHDALIKLLQHERLELAKDHVNVRDMLDIRFLSGQAENCRKLILTLRDNYKKHRKAEKDAANKQKG